MKPLIIAPVMVHADTLARDIGLHPQGWVFINCVERLYGLGRGGLAFVCIDTFNQMQDWPEIAERLLWDGCQRCDISLDKLRGISRR